MMITVDCGSTVSNMIGDDPIPIPNPAITKTRLPTNIAKSVSNMSTTKESIDIMELS
jgi:hypothetical protein